jgi:hypothetical protein
MKTGCFPYLTTISVELGFLWNFVLPKLKTCSLYHENQFHSTFGSSHIASFAYQMARQSPYGFI